jgi:hypothetical protein
MNRKTFEQVAEQARTLMHVHASNLERLAWSVGSRELAAAAHSAKESRQRLHAARELMTC